MNITPAQKSIFNEDIVPTGETILGQPCVVWSMTVSCDVASAGVVKFYDSLTATNCILKVVLTTGTPTAHLPFPKGKNFETGIYATSSAASVNVALDYD